MKTTVLFLLTFVAGFAQAPTITGDTMLCPDSNGTAVVTGSQVYDSYTWYTKYWFTSDPFVEVSGVNGASFTYDWYTYDQHEIKVVVTLDGNTYESNTIQIDSYAWVGMVTAHDMGDNVTFDTNTETFILCEGTSFPNEIYNPYTFNIQWFRNDMPINGANSMQYQITEAGTYYVTAAPEFCPNNTSKSLPISVAIDPNCNLGTDEHDWKALISMYPNPVERFLYIESNETIDLVAIYNLTGQLIRKEKFNGSGVSTEALAEGMYVIDLQTAAGSEKLKFVKN